MAIKSEGGGMVVAEIMDGLEVGIGQDFNASLSRREEDSLATMIKRCLISLNWLLVGGQRRRLRG
jgi:hypothetical protein